MKRVAAVPRGSVDAAVEEAEEDEEGRAKGPEAEGDREFAQQAPVDLLHDQAPGDRGGGAEDNEVGEGFADRAVAVVGPEGKHRRDAASGQRDRKQDRQPPLPARGCPQRGRRHRQGGQDQMQRQQVREFPLHGREGSHKGRPDRLLKAG